MAKTNIRKSNKKDSAWLDERKLYLVVRVLDDVTAHDLAEILGALLDGVRTAEGQLVVLEGNLPKKIHGWPLTMGEDDI